MIIQTKNQQSLTNQINFDEKTIFVLVNSVSKKIKEKFVCNPNTNYSLIKVIGGF